MGFRLLIVLLTWQFAGSESPVKGKRKALQERKRFFKRWPVAIPCTVLWDELVLKGMISNISYGGAFIDRVNAVPPNNATVIVRFHFIEGGTTVKGKVESRIIHSIEQVLEDGVIGSFGVEFTKLQKVLQPNLLHLIERLSDETIGPK